jgi:hypothetical protein
MTDLQDGHLHPVDRQAGEAAMKASVNTEPFLVMLVPRAKRAADGKAFEWSPEQGVRVLVRNISDEDLQMILQTVLGMPAMGEEEGESVDWPEPDEP